MAGILNLTHCLLKHPLAKCMLPSHIKHKMNTEIDILLTAAVVEKTTLEGGEFISPVSQNRKKTHCNI